MSSSRGQNGVIDQTGGSKQPIRGEIERSLCYVNKHSLVCSRDARVNVSIFLRKFLCEEWAMSHLEVVLNQCSVLAFCRAQLDLCAPLHDSFLYLYGVVIVLLMSCDLPHSQPLVPRENITAWMNAIGLVITALPVRLCSHTHISYISATYCARNLKFTAHSKHVFSICVVKFPLSMKNKVHKLLFLLLTV